MRLPWILAGVLAFGAAAQEPAAPAGDPVLERLISEALAARPEVAAARARVRAEEERARQAGVLPDPMLQLGAQRDQMVEAMPGGEVMVENGTYFSAMVSQAVPFPTKLFQRARLARVAIDLARADVARWLLATEADVRRQYVDLVLIREQRALLDATEVLWKQSEQIARTRYEVGEAPQTDLLRAQLERSRLRQQRLAIDANERVRVQQLNRLRARPLDGPVETATTLVKMSTPDLGTPEAALEDARRRSPELARAQAGLVQAQQARALARSDLLPDLGAYAGVMPQGSELMWQAGIQISLPVYAFQKQLPAISEAGARTDAAEREVDTVLQVLALRTRERAAALEALNESNRIFSGGLLVQSEAAASSAVAQYQTGRVPFTTVLEALGGFLADRGAFLQTLAAAQRLAIQAREVSLDPVDDVSAGSSGGGMSGGGSKAMNAGASRTGRVTGGAAPTEGSTAGGGMGGM